MKKEQYMRIRERLREIIKGTQWEGHVYCVGGCVRDDLMGLDIKDIDMVVDLPGGGVRFAEWLHENAFTTGDVVTYARFGTAMLRLKEFPEEELEFVQSRKEKYIDRNSRKPETAFGTIEDDSLRRDLTINSLDVNISTGELVDVTGLGVDDIRDHIIRTPADPDLTYDDDPLRILRCVRFATRFGWDISKETFEGMKKNAYRLEIISPERRRIEFEKMLVCERPVEAMQLLKDCGAMHFVIPELEETYDMGQNKFHFGSVWEHTLKVLEEASHPALPFRERACYADSDKKLVIRLAALLHDIGKISTRSVGDDGRVHFYEHESEGAKMIDKILRRLTFPNEVIKKVEFLVAQHMRTKQWKDDLSGLKESKRPRKLRELQFLCRSEERFLDLMLLVDADNKAHAEGYCLLTQVDRLLAMSEELKSEGKAMFDYELPFDGEQIMQMRGLAPGPEVREHLDHLLTLAYVEPVRSKDEWTKLLMGYSPKV